MDSVGELTVAEPAVSQATDRAAWLNERKKGIGGSDVAAILGLSKWSTPYQVYADKRGEAEDKPGNVDMLIGTMLEPWLFDEYKRVEGADIQKIDEILYDKEYPFLFANVDGLREDRVVEFKTARDDSEWGQPGTDQCPAAYVLQVQHYMRVADKPLCDLGVLFKSSRVPELVIYRIERDDELLGMVIPKLVEFWNCVVEGVAPAAISSDDANWKYRKSEPKAISATDDIAKSASDLRRVKDAMATLKEQQDLLEARIKEYMQTNDVLKSGSDILATWKTAKGATKIDVDRLRAEQPKLAEQYSKTFPGVRKFLLK